MLRLSRILVPAALVAAVAAAGVYTWMRPEANPAPAVAGAASGSVVPGQPGSGSTAPVPPGPARLRPVPAAGAAVPLPPGAADARGTALAKLVFTDPQPAPATFVTDPAGGEHALADWRGKWLLVNFWAVWCVPCRVEMPALDALEAEFGGDRFAVLTVATGRNQPQAIDRFFEETGVANLPKLLDPRMALSGGMGVLGLPVTVLVDPAGNEVARLIGDADWHSDEARALVAALIAAD